jgi:hypothetical protein
MEKAHSPLTEVERPGSMSVLLVQLAGIPAGGEASAASPPDCQADAGGAFGWLGAVGVSSSAGRASRTPPGLACVGGATYRIGDCPGAQGFGDGIRKMRGKMKYSGKRYKQ